MCGIAGIIGNYAKFDFGAMLQSQHHRGPDATKICTDAQNAIFGHNRLSIIDLSSAADQPFFDNSERYCIVFNGEIYNYLEIKSDLLGRYNFKTNSDTEVLLAAYIIYGQDCLHKFNGMFTFAIWDFESKKLFAARDRFGVKPFYFTEKDHCFLFCSEIKALHAAGIEKLDNEKVWAQYFAFDYYGDPNETFFENINQLPASHYLTYQNGKLNIEKWYFLEKEVAKYDHHINFEQAKSKYLDLLIDSISLRLRADVQIGVNVSGGLDSSILLHLVDKIKQNKSISAYTFYTNSPVYDELEWVESIVKQTKNPLSKSLLNANEFKDLFEQISTFQDEPFGGIPTLAYAKIFQKARQDQIIVLLDGQGLDEQFAGYDYYTQNNNNFIQGIKPVDKLKLLSKTLQKKIAKPFFPKPFNDDLRNKQYRDLFFTKIPRALRFNDRISMAFSTELREPFLDYRLVELAFSLPVDFKIKLDQTKFLLHSIAKTFLPNNIVFTPKRALQTPQREWLSNDLRQISAVAVQKILNSKQTTWLDKRELEKTATQFFDGDTENSFFIWQCISLANTLD